MMQRTRPKLQLVAATVLQGWLCALDQVTSIGIFLCTIVVFCICLFLNMLQYIYIYIYIYMYVMICVVKYACVLCVCKLFVFFYEKTCQSYSMHTYICLG